MNRIGFVGWRGMVGSVLMERMRAEDDFAHIAEPVFFSTSQQGEPGPDVGRGATALRNARQAFALELAHGMVAGVTLNRAMAVLGGRGGRDDRSGHAALGSRGIVGDDALEIINHVFAFAGRGELDPERIAASAAEQCRGGGFDFERGAPGGAEGLRRMAGSGILLNPQGVLLTADSVIAECGGLRSFRGGGWHDTRVLRRDSALGLAVLVADGLHGRPGVFAEGDAPLPPTLQAVSLPLRGVLSGEPSIAEATLQPPAPSSRPTAACTASCTGNGRS